MKRSSPRRESFSIAREGQGIVNHAGAAVLRELADRFEYTSTLCDGLDPLRARRATHHPGAVLTDLAVSIADGGDCLRELAVLHDQPDLFGHVASVPTASRVISRLTRGHLEQLRAARRRMRDQVWRKAGRPELLVLDIDATLVTSHSEKEEASGNYKHGFGFHPLACFLEATGDALSALLRGGSAGSNTARDHIEVFRLACDQLPEWVQEEPMLVRCDSAGASHDFLNAVRAREKAKFWVGFELREEVREAILKVPEEAWEAAIRQDGEDREGAEVCELDQLDLCGWPTGTRAICRRERPHPGAQLSFTDHQGWRFQVFITDQEEEDTEPAPAARTRSDVPRRPGSAPSPSRASCRTRSGSSWCSPLTTCSATSAASPSPVRRSAGSRELCAPAAAHRRAPGQAGSPGYPPAPAQLALDRTSGHRLRSHSRAPRDLIGVRLRTLTGPETGSTPHTHGCRRPTRRARIIAPSVQSTTSGGPNQPPRPTLRPRISTPSGYSPAPPAGESFVQHLG